MERPYIVCHMVCSIDGRIGCDMVDHISGDEYYEALDALQCTALLEGRVSMQIHHALSEPFDSCGSRPVGKPSFQIHTEARNFCIAVDTCGRLQWAGNEIDGQPLLVICSEKVSAAYLERLDAQHISWICLGRDKIDLKAAMHLLRHDFGVERLAVCGGGHINNAFLRANLIDEVSLIVAPGIDGREGKPCVFDGEANTAALPVGLTLTSLQQFPNGSVWLRYTFPSSDK